MNDKKFVPLFYAPQIRLALKPEDKMCVTFANYLKKFSMEGKLKAVWLHIPNEFSGKQHFHFGNKLRMMGKIKGAYDYVFTWGTGSGFIEFKAGKNKLTSEQQIFGDWCAVNGVSRAVVYSVSQALDALKEWGVLDKSAKFWEE